MDEIVIRNSDRKNVNNIDSFKDSDNNSEGSLRRSSHADSTTARSFSSIPVSKPCELPMSSPHHGVYNALSLSRVHAADKVTSR